MDATHRSKQVGFKLIGFENPLVDYPTTVLPVGKKDSKLVAVFLSYNGKPDYVNISKKEFERNKHGTFVRLDFTKKRNNKLRNFHPATHRLFAFSENDVEKFEVSSKDNFYKSIISHRQLITKAPFVALPLAIEAKDEILIKKTTIQCGNYLKKMPEIRTAWYDDIKSKSKFLPPKFNDLVKKKSQIVAPKNKYTATVPPNEVAKIWYHVDADGLVLGRLASVVSTVLRGKHKPEFSPFLDLGDFVIVTNAKMIGLTGKKYTDKVYYKHSGYTGGLKKRRAIELLNKNPEQVITHAVKGMLPKNRLGRKLIKKLKVYAGPDHPHIAQKPVALGTMFGQLSDNKLFVSGQQYSRLEALYKKNKNTQFNK